jgi:hypothetical protein
MSGQAVAKKLPLVLLKSDPRQQCSVPFNLGLARLILLDNQLFLLERKAVLLWEPRVVLLQNKQSQVATLEPLLFLKEL